MDTFLNFGGNASNQHVDIADSNDFDLTGGSFTLSAWIRPTNFGQANQGRIVDHGGGSSGAGGWTLQLMDRAAFVNQGLMVQIEGGGPFVSNPNVITLGAWQHVAVTLDAGTLTFYVNGVASGVATYQVLDNYI